MQHNVRSIFQLKYIHLTFTSNTLYNEIRRSGKKVGQQKKTSVALLHFNIPYISLLTYDIRMISITVSIVLKL